MVGLRNALKVLSNLSAHIVNEHGLHDADSGEGAQKRWFRKIEEELEALEAEFEQLGKILEDLRGMVSLHRVSTLLYYNSLTDYSSSRSKLISNR